MLMEGSFVKSTQNSRSNYVPLTKFSLFVTYLGVKFKYLDITNNVPLAYLDIIVACH